MKMPYAWFSSSSCVESCENKVRSLPQKAHRQEPITLKKRLEMALN